MTIKYLITVAMWDAKTGLEFIGRWLQHGKSNIDFDIQFVVAEGDNKNLISLAKTVAPTHVRPNIARDFGSFWWSHNQHKDKDYTHYLFLDDDVHFICEDWLQRIHDGFSVRDNVGVVGIHVAFNHERRRIPRGAFWAMPAEQLDRLNWREPTCHEDAHWDELQLAVPLYDTHCIVQVGNGTDILDDFWGRCAGWTGTPGVFEE